MLTGLYPPRGDQQWSVLVKNWQPIPIRSFPVDDDPVTINFHLLVASHLQFCTKNGKSKTLVKASFSVRPHFHKPVVSKLKNFNVHTYVKNSGFLYESSQKVDCDFVSGRPETGYGSHLLIRLSTLQAYQTSVNLFVMRVIFYRIGVMKFFIVQINFEVKRSLSRNQQYQISTNFEKLENMFNVSLSSINIQIILFCLYLVIHYWLITYWFVKQAKPDFKSIQANEFTRNFF